MMALMVVLLIICTAIALTMIGYCLRKSWKIEETKEHTYRETQYDLQINHDNDEFYEDKNDFIQHKSELIVEEEDDLDNFNLDI